MKRFALVIICLILLVSATLSQAQTSFKPKEYIVDEIKLTGNTFFSERYLYKQLGLKEKRPLSKASTFTRRLLELDRLLLQTLYIKNGFLYCTVTASYEIEASSQVDVEFIIEEGRQYSLKEIVLSGNSVLSTDRILAMLDHPLDQPYNTVQIKNGIQRIRDAYSNIGKPLAVVEDSIVVNEGIHLHLHIRENPTMYVGNIELIGNDLVQDKSVLREIILERGDLYAQDQIALSKKHIYETGLFSGVNIKIARVDTLEGVLDLQVDVRELRMRYLGFDVGMGQDKGIGGGEPYTSVDFAGEWLHRNVFQRGSRFSTALKTSINLTSIFVRPKTEAEILYVEPWLWGFRSATSFRLFVNNQVLPEQAITKYGGEVALTYKPDKRFFLRSGIEINGIRYQTDQYATAIDESDRERAISFTLRDDRRDDFLFPKQGSLFTINSKVVGLLLGGTQDYYKLESSYSQYLRLWGDFVFAYRVKLGWLAAFGDGESPKYEKFYLGGASSLRGWREREFLLTGGVPQGDDLKVLTNAEIRFPLFWRLGGEIFLDGGNLASDIKSLTSQHFRINVGVGLTLATPLGPMRVEYARIVDPQGDETEKPWQLQFSIPYAF